MASHRRHLASPPRRRGDAAHTATGLTLVVAIASLVGLLLALEVQVRCAEEPHLRRAHGAADEAHAGRFVRRAWRLRLR